MWAPRAYLRRYVMDEVLLIMAGVMVLPGCGTNSQNGSRSRREKGKAILLDWPNGIIRRQ
jgi:hypothetical protein